MSDTELNVKIGADTAGLKDGLSEASGAVRSASDNMKNGMSGVVSEALKVTAAFIGIREIMGQVKSAFDISGQFEQMQIGIAAIIGASSENVTAMGATVNATQKFAIAQRESMEAVSLLRKANLQTIATLPELTEAFQAALAPARSYGLTVKDTVGFTKDMANAAAAIGMPMNQLSQEIRAVLEGDTSRNSRVNQILQITPAIIQAHRAAGDLGEYLHKRLEDYAVAGDAMAHSWVGIKSNIEDAIINIKNIAAQGVFNQLKQDGIDIQSYLTNNAQSIASVFSEAFKNIYIVAKNAFDSIKDAFSIVADLINSIGSKLSPFDTFLLGLQSIISGLRIMADIAIQIAAKIGHAFLEAWHEIYAGWNEMVVGGIMRTAHRLGLEAKGITESYNEGLAKSRDIYKSMQAIDQTILDLDKDRANEIKKIVDLYGKMQAAAPKEQKAGSTDNKDHTKAKPAEESEEERKKREKEAIEAEKLANKIIEINNQVEEMKLDGLDREEAKAKEVYDKERVSHKGSKDYQEAVENKYNATLESINRKRLEILTTNNKKIADEQLSIQRQQIEDSKTMSMIGVQDEIDALNLKKQYGKVSAEEELTTLKKIEAEKFEIEKTALAEKIALMKAGTLELAKANNDMLILETKHAQQMKVIDNKIAADASSGWKGVAKSMTDSMGTAIGDLINFTTTWKNAFKSVISSMLGTFTQFIGKKVMAWAVGEETMTVATVAGNITRVASNAWANMTSLAMTVATAIKTIAIYAWQAAAGAYAAIASIPIIGPFLAPVVAAGAVVAVTSMVGNIASAEGGFDIPNGVNPMTQLHQNEMVLPAHIAQPLRENLAGGGLGGGTHITIHAVDAKSVKDLFMAHGDTLVKSLKNQNRNFNV